MSKCFKWMLVAVAVMALVSNVQAAFVTNSLGQVIEVRSLDDVATDVRDDTVWQDQSVYANQNARFGYIVCHYSFAKFGGTNADDGIALGMEIPENAILTGPAIIDVTEAFGPATSTGEVRLCTVGATNVSALFMAPTLATAITGSIRTNTELVVSSKLTAPLEFRFKVTNPSMTSGAFSIIQPYWNGND